MNTSKDKGDILEDLVGLLYEGGRERVNIRSKMQSIFTKTRKREIDVLLTSDIMGFPIHTVFECKNHRKKIGIELIDAFIGFLEDVGIPKSRGLFVSPIGFTKDAKDRAADVGIRTLLFDGLTSERLATEVNTALQSVIYFVATWRQLNKFTHLPSFSGSGPGIQAVVDPLRHGCGETALLNVLWEQWISGSIPSTLGTHVLSLSEPSGGLVIAEVEVTAHVAVLKGTSSQLSLSHLESRELEKMRVHAEFEPPDSRVDLLRFESDEKLRAHLAKGSVHVYSAVRVPRLVSSVSYWPPSEQAVIRLRERIDQDQMIDFCSIEGSNILNAWARPWRPTNSSYSQSAEHESKRSDTS